MFRRSAPAEDAAATAEAQAEAAAAAGKGRPTPTRKEAEAARKAAALEEKKPQGTGLHVPQKMKKCYNCAICRLQTPLERLNNRYKMSRK